MRQWVLLSGSAAKFFGVVGGAHLVGAAEHDLADELLHGPAVLHEADGEMIQQLGVRGLSGP